MPLPRIDRWISDLPGFVSSPFHKSFDRRALGTRYHRSRRCSATPGKAADKVPAYLRRHGYGIIPVNPFRDEIFERELYDSVADVAEGTDVVEIFHPSDEVAGIVDEALNCYHRDITVGLP